MRELDAAGGSDLSLGASIRQIRQQKQMTVEQLAQSSGLSIALISKIERGLGNPSINSLRQIAKALGVPTALFFASESNDGSDRVGYNNKRVYAYPRSRVSYTALVSPIADDVNFLVIEAMPGAAGGSEPICHQGFEQGMVIEGTMDLTVGDRTYHLEPMDTISFPSTIPHRWVNVGKTRCRSVWAIAANHPLGVFASSEPKDEPEGAGVGGVMAGQLRHGGEHPVSEDAGEGSPQTGGDKDEKQTSRRRTAAGPGK